MKQKIILVVLALAGLIHTHKILAQCYAANWGGITFASAELSSGLHPNTIYIRWPASLTVERYTVMYQDITISGDWTTAVTNLNDWHYYLSVNTAHNYNIAVVVTCPDGTSKTSVRYQVEGENFSQIGNCLGVWNGLTTYSTDGTSLTVRWTDAKVDHYEVWTKLNDFFANPPTEWIRRGGNISELSYTITGLEAQESYQVMIVAVCRDGTRIQRIHGFSIYIDGITTARCDEPFGLYETSTTTTADLFAVMYTYLLGVNIQYFVTYSEASSNVYTTVEWTFPGLNQPSGVAIAKRITGLKPNTLYTWYITMVCNGFAQNTGYSFSRSSKFFTKPLPPGPCNSVQGNYTAPAINNTAGTNLYTGTITSVSPVTLSTVTRRFVATAVQLNPGFATAVSGTGSFMADAFNPANCATIGTRAAPQEEIQEDSVTVPAIPVNLIEQIKQQPGRDKAINVYPNPTTGILNIILKDPAETVRKIVIMDVSGRTVLVSAKGNKTIEMSKLNAGTYFYIVETSAGRYNGKVLKL
jgi:Secretion system C-terminal sorting domain